ncbi:glycosyltransferase family 39 protein [archaeon AH-315-M20]|nr:glycosyltransferase family 39 protein [archaeon AH-315-M20]
MFKKLNEKNIFGNTKLLLFIIVLLGLILRLTFFSGIGTSDSLVYTKYTYNIDKGIDPNSTLTLSTRLGLIYSTAFSYKLFGINDFSSVIFVLLTSIGSIILIFYFGKLLFNKKIGLMAAFLLSFFPLDVVYATKLLADIPSAFFMGLGIYIFLYSEIKSKLRYGIGYFLSGVFIGIGYFIRESVLLIILFFIIYILYKKEIKKKYFLVPLGVLLIFAIETLIFFTLTGDPLFRSHASQQYLAEASVEHNYFGRLDFPTGLFHYPHLILTNNLLSFFYIVIFIAIIYFIINKKKETYTLMFWFIPLLLYLSFGSGSFTQYIPLRAVDRYLSIITIPGILLMAFFLTEKKALIKRVIMPLVLIILITTSVAFVYVREDRHLLDSIRELYPYLETLDKTVFIDDRSLKALVYVSGYNNQIDLKEYPKDMTTIKDVYIVINKEMVRGLKDANRNRVFPSEIDNPPTDWMIIKEMGKNGEDKIVVYYVP